MSSSCERVDPSREEWWRGQRVKGGTEGGGVDALTSLERGLRGAERYGGGRSVPTVVEAGRGGVVDAGRDEIEIQVERGEESEAAYSFFSFQKRKGK